jgi:hypothetical protein
MFLPLFGTEYIWDLPIAYISRVGLLESVSFSCGPLHTKDVGQQIGWQEKD